MRFLLYKFRPELWVILFSILSCNNYLDSETINGTTFEADYSNLIKSNSIASQLTTFLGPGDYFEFYFEEELDNTLIFESVHDFIHYKNNHALFFESEVTYNNGYHSTGFRDILNKTSSINIMIIQKLDHEDILQNYIIKNILSSLNGNILGKNWGQTNYEYALLNGTAIIDLYGEIHYRISIADMGVDFFDLKHYKMIIDIHTGIPLSFLDADE